MVTHASWHLDSYVARDTRNFFYYDLYACLLIYNVIGAVKVTISFVNSQRPKYIFCKNLMTIPKAKHNFAISNLVTMTFELGSPRT